MNPDLCYEYDVAVKNMAKARMPWGVGSVAAGAIEFLWGGIKSSDGVLVAGNCHKYVAVWAFKLQIQKVERLGIVM